MADKSSFTGSLKNSLLDSGGKLWNYVKNNPVKSSIVGVSALALAPVAPALLGVAAAGAVVVVGLKTSKDLVNDYTDKNPDTKTAKFVGTVKKGANIIKSVGKSLKNTLTTARNNKWKTAGVVLGTAVLASTVGPIAIAIAAGGVALKTTLDVRKDLKEQKSRASTSQKPELVKKNPTMEKMKAKGKVVGREVQSPGFVKNIASAIREKFTNQKQPLPVVKYNAKENKVTIGGLGR